jgi:hypothetical protein
MAIVYTSDMPGASREMIEAVTNEMDVASNPPAGMLIHTASELPGGGVRIVDVWDSRESHATFARDRLGPALGKVAQQLGVDMSSMPPAAEEFVDVFDVKHGA